ncbi:MAG: hydrogenase nickel incorporation protein HypB [Pseudomonadota bacterium]
MCTVCGCGAGEVRIEGKAAVGHHHDHHHDHGHDGHHHHHDDHLHDYGSGPAGTQAPGMSQARMVRLEKDILAKNDEYADANRSLFAERGVLALNLVSSPGSGKTTLLCQTIEALEDTLPIAVIEGDQQTSNDADRIRATGAPAVQVNTGKGCHLDAHMVGHAARHLGLADGSLLFIENVGNLVCPAGFDLGEAHKVVILSVTEGEDKPLKYPDMFHAADLMVLNKTDLLPHLDFDVDACIANARKVNPRIKVLKVSARTGEGMADWIAWVQAARRMALAGHRAATGLEGAA